MQFIILASVFVTLSYGIPIPNKRDDKKPVDGKLLTVATLTVEKSLHQSKDKPTLVSTEEIVFSSTGYPTFEAFDQNSDGVIEFEEFAASDGKEHKSNFQKADTNGDQKLTPEEFGRLPLVVYEAEQFSDSDEEPPVVFLTPPESISRYSEKDANLKPIDGYDEAADIPEIGDSKEEPTKKSTDRAVKKEEIVIESNEKSDSTKESEKSETKTDSTKNETPTISNVKANESSQFTADDMPVKIDDEDDEDMIEVRDEDIPAEAVDDLSDDQHYDMGVEDMRDIQEDDKQMNEQINRID